MSCVQVSAESRRGCWISRAGVTGVLFNAAALALAGPCFVLPSYIAGDRSQDVLHGKGSTTKPYSKDTSTLPGSWRCSPCQFVGHFYSLPCPWTANLSVNQLSSLKKSNTAKVGKIGRQSREKKRGSLTAGKLPGHLKSYSDTREETLCNFPLGPRVL